MRILHVVPTYAPAWRYGGTIHAVHGLCRALAAAGHDVEVYTTSVDGESDLDVPCLRPVMRDGVAVTYFPSAHLRRLYRAPLLGRALETGIGRFDVVHTHSVFLWPTWAAARAARAAGRPYVLSPRGMLVPELIRARSAWIKRIWIRAVERRNLAGANIIHVTSDVEARHLEWAGLALAPVRVVPNGVELPALPDGPRQPREVLYLGRLSWKKNLPALIDAVAGLPDARLVIAGPDDEGLAPSLRARAEERGASARVDFRGPVESAAKTALLAESACLVLPSLNENFGNVVAEAMAHACPVVVTPDVGAREIVEESGGGTVATDVTAAALAAAITPLLDSPPLARSAGEKGRRFVAERLTWPAVAARMARLYDEARSTHVSSTHAR
jgi:glycosyltransferase involved in cell wall biosynthesis